MSDDWSQVSTDTLKQSMIRDCWILLSLVITGKYLKAMRLVDQMRTTVYALRTRQDEEYRKSMGWPVRP